MGTEMSWCHKFWRKTVVTLSVFLRGSFDTISHEEGDEVKEHGHKIRLIKVPQRKERGWRIQC